MRRTLKGFVASVALLLARSDVKLAGLPSGTPPSTAAARLAAAAGFFPVPPFATAFHLAALVSPSRARRDERALVCLAADAMAAGISAATPNAHAGARSERRRLPKLK